MSASVDPAFVFSSIPFVTRRASPLDVPLSALLRMLRVETVDDMMEYIFPDVSSENEDLVAMVRRALEDTNTGTTNRGHSELAHCRGKCQLQRAILS